MSTKNWVENVKNTVDQKAEEAAKTVKTKIGDTTHKELDEIRMDIKQLHEQRREDIRAFLDENRKTLICQVFVAAGVFVALHALFSMFHHHKRDHRLF